jgi:N-acylneuraminate cytidylyltransferase|tara:strand:- start:283 stop:798 length:516 start_codon:yes stop_codon:yes gene_type:complete
MKKLLLSKIKKIEILLTDVDCVLTDCGMYYDKRGDSMKKFHTRDGMAVTLLRKKSIPTIIVTKEKTIIVRKWAKRMKVYKTYDGIVDKVSILSKICKTFNVKSEQVAYIGDDVNDLELLKNVGFSAVPNDAISEAKIIADYICKTNGGNGVLREIADLVISAKFGTRKKLY